MLLSFRENTHCLLQNYLQQLVFPSIYKHHWLNIIVQPCVNGDIAIQWEWS